MRRFLPRTLSPALHRPPTMAERLQALLEGEPPTTLPPSVYPPRGAWGPMPRRRPPRPPTPARPTQPPPPPPPYAGRAPTPESTDEESDHGSHRRRHRRSSRRSGDSSRSGHRTRDPRAAHGPPEGLESDSEDEDVRRTPQLEWDLEWDHWDPDLTPSRSSNTPSSLGAWAPRNPREVPELPQPPSPPETGDEVPLPRPTLVGSRRRRPRLQAQRADLRKILDQLARDCFQLRVDVEADLDTFFGKLGIEPRV
ncbi:E4 [Martes foina papillomavirus 1]|uniref:E4 n=1 Tax=Martes foina papillomavirus 1 TaxID=2831903 RepID=A0AAE7UUN5_9PAPI|nr:E4 [Martes foina papillomavirus 1]